MHQRPRRKLDTEGHVLQEPLRSRSPGPAHPQAQKAGEWWPEAQGGGGEGLLSRGGLGDSDNALNLVEGLVE